MAMAGGIGASVGNTGSINFDRVDSSDLVVWKAGDGSQKSWKQTSSNDSANMESKT